MEYIEQQVAELFYYPQRWGKVVPCRLRPQGEEKEAFRFLSLFPSPTACKGRNFECLIHEPLADSK